MTSVESPVIDFYPLRFKLDVNGAAYAWMGVNLLPFIDAQRLFKAMAKVEAQLTEAESQRNSHGQVYVYFKTRGKDESMVKKMRPKPNKPLEASFKQND